MSEELPQHEGDHNHQDFPNDLTSEEQNPEITPTPEEIEIGLDTPRIVQSSDPAIEYKPMSPIEAFSRFPESFRMGTPRPLITTEFEIAETQTRRTFNDKVRVVLTDYGNGILESWAKRLSNLANGLYTTQDFMENFRKNKRNPREIKIRFWELLQIFGDELKKTERMSEESAEKYKVIEGPIRIITDSLHTK